MHFDPLEARVLLTSLAVLDGVTVSTNGSILNITAPNGSDTVSLHQNGSIFQVDATAQGLARITQQFSLPGTTGISVIAGSGAESITALSTNNPSQEVSVPVTLVGGTGPDTLTGGFGNDSLLGGSGSDLLNGAQGADTMDGGGGTNTADYSSRTVGVTIDLLQENQGAVATADSGQPGEGDLLKNIQNAIGGSGNDLIEGNSSGNVLAGNGGTDTIVGGGGDDTITGNDGVNSLGGGAGNDFLFSQNNLTDSLDGGAGTNFANADPIDILNNIGASSVPGGQFVGPVFTTQNMLNILGRSRKNPPADPAIPNSLAGQLDPSFGPPTLFGNHATVFAVFALPGGKTLEVGNAFDFNNNGYIVLAQYTQGGTLDQTFGYKGEEVTNLGIGNLLPNSAVMDVQGRILVAGTIEFTNPAGFVARFNTDGSLDTGFGSNGVATSHSFGNATTFDGVAVTPDGNIVAVGTDFGSPAGSQPGHVVSHASFINTGPNPTITEFDSTGQFNFGFANNGVETLSVVPTNASMVVVRPNGAIDIGTSGSNNAEIIQLLGSGQGEDSTWGSGGAFTFPSQYNLQGITLNPNGAIAATGGDTGTLDLFVARVKADGTGFDTTFGNNGVSEGSSFDETGYQLQLLSGGRIAIAGVQFQEEGNPLTLTVFDATGNIQQHQSVLAGLSFPSSAALAVRAGSSITLGSAPFEGFFSSQQEFSLIRFVSDGSALDNSFGVNGVVTTQILPDLLHRPGYINSSTFGSNDQGEAITTDNSGNAIVAGITDGQLEVVRFSGTGLDTNFTPFIQSFNGPFTVDAVANDPETGQIYVAGSTGFSFDSTPFIIRLNDQGSLDTTWGNNGDLSGDFFNGFSQNVVAASVSNGVLTLGLSSPYENFMLVQLNTSDGTPVGSFGDLGGGTQFPEFDGNILLDASQVTATSMLVEGDGSILVGGTDGNGPVLIHYTDNGVLDSSFGNDGIASQPSGFGGDRGLTSLFIDSTTNLIIGADELGAGNSSITGLVFEYHTDGAALRHDVIPISTDNGSLPNVAGIVPDATSGNADLVVSTTGDSASDPTLGYFVIPENAVVASPSFNTFGPDNGSQAFYAAAVVPTGAPGDFIIGGTDTNFSAFSNSANAFFTQQSLMAFPFQVDSANDQAGTFNAISGGSQMSSQQIASRPDGTIIDATVISDTTTESYENDRLDIRSLNADGSINFNFTVSQETFVDENVSVDSILQQTDGTFIVGITVANQFVLEKFNADGTPDGSFGNGGQDFTGVFGQLTALANGPNNTIVAAGTAQSEGVVPIVARFNADGSLDMSFANNQGSTEPAFVDAQTTAMVIDSSGNIDVTGTSFGDVSEFFMMQLLPNGDINSNFASGGVFFGAVGDNSSQANAIAVDDQGRIYLGGSAVSNGTTEFAVLQLMPDGTVDTTDGFGPNGQLTSIDSGFSSSINALSIVQGNVLLAVGTASPGEANVPALAEYDLTNGNLLASFGGLNGDDAGEVATDYNDGILPGSQSQGLSVAVQSDGNILVSGLSSNDGEQASFVARYIGSTPTNTPQGVNDVAVNIQDIATNQDDQSVIDSLPPYLAPLFSSGNVDGILQINGTSGDDQINVTYDSGLGQYVVNVNGITQTYDAYSITGIVANGGNGNDTIVIDSSVTIPATINGGNGNDSLVAGGGSEQVNGGNDNDSIQPGGGTDELYGGNGNDTFLTGSGTGDLVDGGLGLNTATVNAGDQFVNIQVSVLTDVMLLTSKDSPDVPATPTLPTPPAVPAQNVFEVTNTNNDGGGSLRAAIIAANAVPAGNGLVEIQFDISGANPQVIQLTDVLPALTRPVYIDGTSQPNYAGTPAVVLDGSQISVSSIGNDDGTGPDGLEVAGGGSTVVGLSIVNFAGNGIVLSQTGSDTVASDYLGVEPDGTAAANGGDGIFVFDTASNLIESNVISGNDANGVEVGNRQDTSSAPADDGATGNSVLDNIIGLDPTATLVRPNGIDGVLIDGAPNTSITGNVIAANTGDGVDVRNTDTVKMIVLQQVVTTVLTGDATGESVTGNAIGTNFNGDTGLGNASDGVALDDLGADSVSGNIIGASGRDGIRVTADSDAADSISTNQIGVDTAIDPSLSFAGTIGNAGNGISLLDDTADVSIKHNVIAGNAGAGVLVGSGAVGNTIRFNEIDVNSGLGIDLNAGNVAADDATGDGVTAPSQNPAAGGNDLLNQPVVSILNGVLTVTDTGAASSSVTVDLYSDPAADPSGYGQGRTYLSTIVLPLDGSGNGTFTEDFNVPSGTVISATATNLTTGDTSEFSNATTSSVGQNAGTIVFDSAAFTVNGNQATATIKLDRVGGSTGAATIEFSTSNGTALAGTDYTAVDKLVDFADGQTTATVQIPIALETVYGPDKTVNLALTGVMAGAVASSQLTIHNPVVEPAITVANPSVVNVTSGTTSLTFDIHLSAPSQFVTTVGYVTADGTALAGTNYDALPSNTATFQPGVVDQLVSVTVHGNAKYAADKTLFLNLNTPVHATLTTTQATGTIKNGAAAPTLAVADTSVQDPTSGTTGLVFTVTLTGSTELSTTVHFATSNGTAMVGTDYMANAGTLTFLPGQTMMTVPVTVFGQNTPGPNKTVLLTLTTPTNSSISHATATGTIVNTAVALPTISVADASVAAATNSTSKLTFTVTLSAKSTSAVSFNVSTLGGTATAGKDYTFAPTLVTIPAGKTSTTVTVTVLAHPYYFASRTFTLVLATPSNATFSKGTAIGTIKTSVNAPSLTIGNATVTAPLSGTVTVLVPVSLNQADGDTVTVSFNTSDGSAKAGTDYVAAGGIVTFQPLQTSATIPITINAATFAKSNITFTVTLTGTPTGGAKITASKATVTIVTQNFGLVYTGADPINPQLTALYVLGTSGNDVIHISTGQGGLIATVDGISHGPFNPNGHLIVEGLDGNDQIVVDPGVTTPAYLFGNDGNDMITAGGGTTLAEGGEGNDSILGGSGRGVLIGGDGADAVAGGSGDALLVAGDTSYDDNIFSMNKIVAEWARTDKSFSARVNDLLKGGGLNGNLLFNAATVFSEPNPPDTLTGGTGGDVFYYNPKKISGIGDIAKNVKAADVTVSVS